MEINVRRFFGPARKKPKSSSYYGEYNSQSMEIQSNELMDF